MSVFRLPSVRVSPFIIVCVAMLLQVPTRALTQTTPAADTSSAPGGFLETATTGLVRPKLPLSVLQALLPARGPFTFPAPYNTSAVRITNGTDCGGGDCVDAVGYSYWRNLNNHVGSDEMLIILGLNRARGGPGPSLFSYNKLTGQVTNRGPLFDASLGRSWASAEGWYWSGTQPTKIYITEASSRMLRYDVITKQLETVFDVAAQFGADKYVWQPHSSDDDKVHSVTLRNSATYEMLGCLVYHEDTRVFQYFPKIGDFNECSVDKSGRWLMSLEDVDFKYDLEMRIFDLATGAERMVWDQDGAVGHGDMGYGYVVGADNWNTFPNAILRWDFANNPLSGFLVFHSPDWLVPAANHISHTNARPGVPPDQQFACGSVASSATGVWGNEIVCFRLDGSLNVLVVAPVMTDLNASGGGSDAYYKEPKGNLDVTGQYFIWTSNSGGNRLDAFIVKVPSQLLMGGTADTTLPTVSLSAPAAGSTVSGTLAVSAAASDNVGVAGVQFRLDGTNLGAEDTAAPYTVSWNTAGASNGSHSLTATARDAAGNTTISAPVAVTVANDITAPVITAVQASGLTTSGATVTWTTNEPANSQVEYGLTTGYGSLSVLDGTLVTAHSGVLAGLAAGTLYHYRARSRDAAGNLALSADFSFTTTPATPPPVSTDPIGTWTLNEGTGIVAADSSGNILNGTLVGGPAWIAGRIGQGLSFDGVDDYVEVPAVPALDALPLTVAVWVRTSATGLHGIVNKYLPASFNGYQIFTNGGSLCAWYFRDASSYVWDGTSCALATPGFNDGQWHHVAFVVDATGGRLYVDGVERTARSWTGTPGPVTTTAGLSFGRYPGIATPHLPGALDDVRIYNRALSAGEVGTLYNPSPGPIGSWSFSEGSGTLAADSSGNRLSGSLIGGPAWIAGRIGQGLSFDGVDDYVTVPHAPALDAFPLSVSTWVRTTDTGLHGVVNKYLPGSFNGYQIFTNGGRLCAWYFRDALNFIWDGTSCSLAAPGFNDGQWHHVAFVVDASGGRLYVDGAQKATRAWFGTPGPASTTASLSFGRYPNILAPYLPGSIDEVHLYARPLAAAEISAIASGSPSASVPPRILVTDPTDPEVAGNRTTNEPDDPPAE